jgi:hypothetical protein
MSAGRPESHEERQVRLEQEAESEIRNEDAKELRNRVQDLKTQETKRGIRGFIQRFFAGGLVVRSSDEWID